MTSENQASSILWTYRRWCSNKRDNNFLGFFWVFYSKCYKFHENIWNEKILCEVDVPCKGIPKIYLFLLFVKKLWLQSRFDIFFSRRGNVILIEFLVNGTLMELKMNPSYTLWMLSVMDIPKGNVKKMWLQSCFIFKSFSLNLSF